MNYRENKKRASKGRHRWIAINIEDRQKSLITAFFLFLIFICSAFSAWKINSVLEGPVINADEFEYINLAKAFAKDKYVAVQYNPLYSACLSSFFRFFSYSQAYRAAQIFNAVIFSMTVFPLYYTTKSMTGNRVLSVATSGICVFFPWRVMTFALWAEPLYYFLFACAVACVVAYLKKRDSGLLYAACVIMGLLFLAKQAGLLLAGAVFAVLFFESFKKRRIEGGLIVSVGIYSVIVIAWIIAKKLFLDGAAPGYKAEIDNIAANLFSFMELLYTASYQTTYYFLSCSFVPTVLIVYFYIHRKEYSEEERLFVGIVAVNAALLIILCAFHYIGFNTPYGRYLTVLIPYITIAALISLGSTPVHDRKHLFSILAVIGLFAFFFNPIYGSVSIKALINAPDSSLWSLLIGDNLGYGWLIGDLKDKAYPLVIIFLIFFFSLLCLAFIKKWILYTLLMLYCIVTVSLGIQNHAYVVGRFLPVNPIHEICKYIFEDNLKNNARVYKASEAIAQNFYLDSWNSGTKLSYGVRDIHTFFMNGYNRFDFGGADTPVAYGYYAVKAPYVVGYYSDPTNLRPGFDAAWTFVDGASTICPLMDDTKEDELNCDAIIGGVENEFTVYKREGDYKIHIGINPDLFESTAVLEYKLFINNKLYGEFTSANVEITINRYTMKKDGELVIRLVPAEGAFWGLSYMEIIPKEAYYPKKGYYIDFADNIWMAKDLMNLKKDDHIHLVYQNDTYAVYYNE